LGFQSAQADFALRCPQIYLPGLLVCQRLSLAKISPSNIGEIPVVALHLRKVSSVLRGRVGRLERTVHMTIKTSLLGAALCLGAALPALAQGGGTMAPAPMAGGAMMGGAMAGGAMAMPGGPTMAMSAQDKLFMARAAEGNLAEITFGQLALGKSRTPGVRQVAQTIIAGHSQSQNELMGLMRRTALTLPPMLSATHMVVQNALSKQKRDGFDKMYMAGQVDDHENTIALFQTEVANGQDPDLKAYATKYLPDIVGHTIMIYNVARQVSAPGIELRPQMPPIPPGVTPTMMGRPMSMGDMTGMAGDMPGRAGDMPGMAGGMGAPDAGAMPKPPAPMQ